MSKKTTKRKTFGLLVDWAMEYQMEVIFGVIDAAKAHDVNIIAIEGGCIYSPREFENERNVLYEMVSTSDIDGLIILSASVGHYVGLHQLADFFSSFNSLPIVSIAQDIDGYGYIGVDNSCGLRELVVHLLEVHHCKKFAVITGPKENQDSNARLKVIKDVLQEYGIDLDERLVEVGDYTIPSGERALRTLLGKAGEEDLDAIIALNDGMALGALDELRARKIQVPDSIVVVGFDNIEISAFCDPPLTTVSASMSGQGVLALELLIKMCNGKKPCSVFQPTRLTLRESCGCISQADQSETLEILGQHGNGCNKEHAIDHITHKLEPLMVQKDIDLRYVVQQIMDSLDSQISGEEAEFLQTCHKLFKLTFVDEDSAVFLNNLLTEIRRYFLPQLLNRESLIRFEDLLHQARVVIGEKTIGCQRVNHHESLQSTLLLSSISEQLFANFDLDMIVNILYNRLPQSGISTFFIDQYIDYPSSKQRKLLLAYNKRDRIDVENYETYKDCLVPGVIFDDGKRHDILVTLLQFAQTHFGLMGSEIEMRNIYFYGELRRIVCSSLSGVFHEREKLLLAEIEHNKSLAQMKKTMEEFVQTILLTVEMRDPYTAGHQSKVAELTNIIAAEMGLHSESIEGIRMAGIIHDLGKICVPAEILNKPGRLIPAEFDLIKEHPRVAYDILKNLEFPWPLAQIILQHHERLNGSGYPFGLKGEDIRLESRILAVADVVEAMMSHRPYRPALGLDLAIDEIINNKGVLYDPDVVDACVKILAKGA